MMNDLQERLRGDLAELTSARLDLGIDADELIRTGRQSLRGRNLRRAVGAASLMLVTTVLAAATLASPGTSFAPVVPAAPASVTGPITDAAYFRVDDAGFSEDTDRLEVDVVAADTGWDVTVIGSRSDGLLTERFAFRQAAAPSAVQLAPRVILELLPTRATSADVVMKDRTRATRSEFMHVGALDLTATLVWFETSTQPEDIAGFIWGDADGVIRDSLGNTVPTVDIALPTRTVRLFWDEHLGVLGHQSPDGEVFTSGFARVSEIYPWFLGGLDGWLGADGAATVLGDVLPEGAHDLEVDLRSTGEWGQALLGGRTIYVVTVPAKLSKPIRAIGYTEANGHRASLRMP